MRSLALAAAILVTPSLKAQVQCDNDTSNFVSLVDLQTGYYLGLYQGGLYPGGSNFLPASHRADGLAIAKAIKPLDTLGNVDWENGKVIFAGMGASTAGNSWDHFVDIVDTASGLNPCMRAINACLGAKGLDIMIDTAVNGWYWYDEILPKIEYYNSSRYQVQVAWIKSASKADTILEFPLFPNAIADKYEALMPILLDTFPNIKLVFISGFFYGGYADPLKEFYDVVVEPGSYWTNFAVKWVIERQITGDPDLAFKGPGRRSPWIAWGPHVWADGMRANEWDGLQWNCEDDFAWDGGGYHLTNTGKKKEADLLFTWAKTNPVTRRWFLDGPQWNSCDPDGRLANGQMLSYGDDNYVTAEEVMLYPSPNDGTFSIKLAKSHTGYAEVTVVNNMGQQVYRSTYDSFIANKNINIRLEDATPGIYFLNINLDGNITTKEFVVK